MSSPVPSKYARALAEVAVELKQESRIQEELAALAELLASHKELWDVLINPAIPFSAKRNIVEEIGRSGSLDQILVNFVLVLLEHAQIHQFQEVVEAYDDVLDEFHGVLRAHVVSSEELHTDVHEQIREIAAQLTGKEVKIDYQVDEALIGGFKLQIGSTIYDGSLQNQLDEIRRRLATQ